MIVWDGKGIASFFRGEGSKRSADNPHFVSIAWLEGCVNASRRKRCKPQSPLNTNYFLLKFDAIL